MYINNDRYLNQVGRDNHFYNFNNFIHYTAVRSITIENCKNNYKRWNFISFHL